MKNEDNVGYTQTLPAGLTDLFGVTVEEVEPIFESNRATVRLDLLGGSVETPDRDWCDLLGGDAQMVGNYVESYKAGQGIVSRNNFGEGCAWYLGTGVSQKALNMLVEQVCAEAGVEANPFEAMEGVQVVRRFFEERPLYYILNFSGETKTLFLKNTYLDCLKEAPIEGMMDIPALGYAVLLAV